VEKRGQNEIELIEKENMRIVRLANQAFNIGDLTKVHEFISPDYVNRVSQGFAEVVEGISSLPNEFRDIIKYRSGLKEQEIIASRERVITLVNVSGKHVGDFFGIPPTGRNFNYEAMHMFRILDNKI
jgi:nogalonic acid methyl ester cyclase / aklanonic acid methyl ester cyclase